jgi:catechol 2,3-dioxygenase-like lactoylglutathione lyase family enzyme
MKRFHVNLSVDDLSESIRFYTALFAMEPTVRNSDYAKWMLDDPRINFAIAERGQAPGVNHLGIQVDSAEELVSMRAQLTRADRALVEQAGAACCYATSDKYWITDPEGIAWETFHTLDAIPIYGADTVIVPKSGTCCVPKEASAQEACCEPAASAADQACCASQSKQAAR